MGQEGYFLNWSVHFHTKLNLCNVGKLLGPFFQGYDDILSRNLMIVLTGPTWAVQRLQILEEYTLKSRNLMIVLTGPTWAVQTLQILEEYTLKCDRIWEKGHQLQI